MHSQNRVQAIKSRFENLNEEKKLEIVIRKRSNPLPEKSRVCNKRNNENELNVDKEENIKNSSDSEDEKFNVANKSYLYKENRTLTRQASDPGKKLHRSHAFRCDRSVKISPKRHSSCKERDMNELATLKISEKPRLSRDRLKRLNLVIENQMRKENYVPNSSSHNEDPIASFRVAPELTEFKNTRSKSCESKPKVNSVPDEKIPQHILDQYAKVVKPKNKNEVDIKEMTDSGVSSETESPDAEHEKGRLHKLRANFENDKTEKLDKSDLGDKRISVNSDVYSSTETIKRKNPNIVLTDTLKKALKQPLPKGPPPRKPPRIFVAATDDSTSNSPEFSPKPERKAVEKIKKDPKHMLERLEKALQKHNELKVIIPRKMHNIYDIAESDANENTDIQAPEKKKKEMHYLCTEILDIAQRPLLADSNQNLNESASNCFTSLNCGTATNRLSASIPYARLNSSDSSQNANTCCSNENLADTRSKFSTFFSGKNEKCTQNAFQCHCCKCSDTESNRSSVNDKTVKDDEHIYDEPFNYEDKANLVIKRSEECVKVCESDSDRKQYGVLICARRKSDADINRATEDLKIYDVPCDPSRSPSPEVTGGRTFESLRRGFENISSESISIRPKSKSLDMPDVKPPPIRNRSFDIPDLKSKSQETSFKPATIKSRLSDSIDVKRLIRSLNSENGSLDDENVTDLKPKKLLEKPLELPDLLQHQTSFDSPDITVSSCSTESLVEVRRSLENKFATDGSRGLSRMFERKANAVGSSLTMQNKCGKRNQIDLDKENLNKLMSEIYDTVSAQCDMEIVSRFPVDRDSVSSEDSTKLSRSLTEKRKTYVRRVSSRAAYLDPNSRQCDARQSLDGKDTESDTKFTTYRSWKSFKRTRNRSTASRNADDDDETVDALDATDPTDESTSSLDATAGCLDIARPEHAERALLDACLLVGMNHTSGQAYIKSVLHAQVQIPPLIENLIFPETISKTGNIDLEPARTQQYSLVLTNEKGERSFGYCRRVLPEGATFCLPLAYCIISTFRAAGFYYKVLQEIESRHGTSDHDMESLLQQLALKDFPNPGESITITQPRSPKKSNDLTNSSVGDSVSNVKKSKTLEPRRAAKLDPDGIPEYYDLEKQVRVVENAPDVKVIKRPIEPRLDEDNLSVLLDSLGVTLLIKVFGTMLLERKVILVSDNLSQLSSCMEALQCIIYPLVWQQPLVSAIPSQLMQDMLEAPLPMLAGCLCAEDRTLATLQFEEGMLIRLNCKAGAKVIFEQGDESTILPSSSCKTLKAALQLESCKNLVGTEKEVEKARNVLIAEAFLRFFVDVLADMSRHYKVTKREGTEWGEPNVGGEDVLVFDREQFISGAADKQTQYFLEWFCETAAFDRLERNLRQAKEAAGESGLVDTPTPRFYEVFLERVSRRLLLSSGARKKTTEASGRNVKSALNKKVRLLKNKLRDLVN